LGKKRNLVRVGAGNRRRTLPPRNGGNVRSAPPFLNSNYTFNGEGQSASKGPKIIDANPAEFSSEMMLSVS
jgi:hypothetical protein